jgi:hypothetical protein
MDEFSRPATLEDLKLLLRSLHFEPRGLEERALEVFKLHARDDDGGQGKE